MDSTAANTLNESNDVPKTTAETNINSLKDTKRQQYNMKQRMDMYAFCVLELELHGNTVSIKKQQQAIQKALKKDGDEVSPSKEGSYSPQGSGVIQFGQPNRHHHPPVQVIQKTQLVDLENYASRDQDNDMNTNLCNASINNQPESNDPFATQLGLLPQQRQQEQLYQMSNEGPPYSIDPSQNVHPRNALHNGCDISSMSNTNDGKTLLQLQREIALNQRCYSDYQKTQVLTSSMLREVQRRFAKYYPDTQTPSRNTIKHVFTKCVEYGTVANVKNPRKPKKIPNEDQIQDLLLHEPQMSLRQMAKKMNVSTGTVSRRCKALGIIPESVTLKQQHMATARRQKQIKQRESKARPAGGSKRANANSRQQAA